ncbi:MAG: M48 family metalloprotease [Saprospiraceae bacterium]|nr:M48 family metalloprotease [Saprospiraceae bacterium]
MAQLLALLLITAGAAWVNWRMGVARMRREIETRALLLADPALEALVARLGAVLGLLRLRARLYDMPAVNGLATPDGEVFLTTGLVQKYRLGALKAEEVASVVAHELGHVALGHHARRMIDRDRAQPVTVLLGVVLEPVHPVLRLRAGGAAGRHGPCGPEPPRRVRGRPFRDRADAEGRAGGRAADRHVPQARAHGWGRPVWLSTHPDIEARIAAIEANAAAWEAAAQARRACWADALRAGVRTAREQVADLAQQHHVGGGLGRGRRRLGPRPRRA